MKERMTQEKFDNWRRCLVGDLSGWSQVTSNELTLFHALDAEREEVGRLREQNGDWEHKHITLRHELTEAEGRLTRLVEVVIGWRECDWPAWFCRRTAEAIADRVRETQALIKEAKE